ncbi:MAG: hypothetical protein IKJ84_02910 [Oscillospiraceae bacterium]|nr:hypothetical protein [Oscillospiraceae bacterium]
MADKKKTQQKRPAARRAPAKRKTARRPGSGIEMSLAELFRKRREKDLAEFKPDATTATWIKTMKLTQQQRLRLTKWGLYILTVVLSLVIQDVVMSQFSFFGATTNLPVCAILLITVIEGTEVGSLFVLIASLLYYFSGTAPTALCIGLLTFLGIGATLVRQMYLHRSQGSVVLCSAIALTGYEIGLFAVGISSGLTHFGRLIPFVLTALLSCLVLIPMYSLIYKIGMIGGNTWKE